jgi:hypothetical protein
MEGRPQVPCIIGFQDPNVEHQINMYTIAILLIKKIKFKYIILQTTQGWKLYTI